MSVRILCGDVRNKLAEMPDESVHCVVTSPPYFGLRDYGVAGQIGLEDTPTAFLAVMVDVFREVRRVLRNDGVLFLNLGDSYFTGNGRTTGGCSPKSTLGGGGGRYRKGSKNEAMFNGGAGSPRAASYDKDGKELEGSLARDCFCQSLCGACREAYRTGRAHSGHGPVSTPPVSNVSSSRERRVSQSDHLPTSGLAHQGDRNSGATHDRQHSPTHAAALLPSSPESMLGEYGQQPPAGCRQSVQPLGCRLCGRSLPDCAPESADSSVYIEGTGSRPGASCECMLGNSSSDLAWGDYTTTSRLKPKDLMGIPWRVAFALQADGWYLRQDIIWSKPNPMPESVTDRCTKAHEYLFLLSKSARYHFDAAAIAETAAYPGDDRHTRTDVRKAVDPMCMDGGSRARTGNPTGETRNRRSVWTVATQPFSDWHETVHREPVAPDAAVGGKKRTTSPDCPLHGDRAGRASNAPCDERAKGQSSRNQRTDADLALAPQADCAPIETRPALATGQRSSDLPGLSCEPSASDRSNRSRKMGRDPATTLACTASAQTLDRTGGTSKAHEPSGSADHTPASNSGQGETGDHPSVQTTGRSARNSSCDPSECTCEWYIEKTTKTSHFATFPPALIEPCILAGCPKGGTVLDPFFGAGTTGLVADRHGRDCIGIELNPAYAAIAEKRIKGDAPLFAEVA